MPYTNQLPTNLDCVDVLRHCSDIGVMIMDRDFVVHDYNDGAARMFFIDVLNTTTCSSTKQKPRQDVRPPFQGEWIDHVKTATSDNMPITVDHVFNAQRFMTTFAPLETELTGNIIAMSHPGEPAIPDAQQIIRTVPGFDDLGPLRVLSRRELEVFLLLGEGRRINEVSNLLHRSARTIETHRRSIGLKMGIHSLGEIIRFTTSRSLKFDVVFPNKDSHFSMDTKPQT